MPYSVYDAVVEHGLFSARLRALTPEARDWIETHVTLRQVRTWSNGVLEVAAHDLEPLVTGMLADGLQVVTLDAGERQWCEQYHW